MDTFLFERIEDNAIFLYSEIEIELNYDGAHCGQQHQNDCSIALQLNIFIYIRHFKTNINTISSFIKHAWSVFFKTYCMEIKHFLINSDSVVFYNCGLGIC